MRNKLLSMVLAVALALGVCVPAYADTTYTLTLNKAQAGHTYTAYQIFTGDLSGDVLSNIEWGSGVTAEGQAALQTKYGDSAAEVAEALDKADSADAFAAEAAEYLGIAAGSVTIAKGSTTGAISGLAAGYYLVKTTGVTGTNDVYTYYIMKVVKDTAADIKADVPKVGKTVDDNDANIGDTVTFTLTGTMPSTVAGYETYKVIFHDTMSAGLTYGSITSVTVGGNAVTSEYEVASEVNAGGETILTITFADVLALGAEASSVIEVQYTATVNSSAVIGTEGNPNTVYLEYSNNPNWDGSGEEPTGDTPEDTVKVCTWEIPVFKYTGTDTPLAGAGFTLYKDADCTAAVNLVAAGNNVYKVCTLAGCEHALVAEVITDDLGKLEIEGLEKGTYYLKETTTPAGYNTCDVVTIIIGENGDLTQNGTATSEVAILNQAGATLPETGGMGTTALYVGGAALVIGAAVLLVVRRRSGAAEE